MPNFQSVGSINLQSGDKLSWEFEMPAATSATEKGAIPYGTTIASVVVTAYNSAGDVVTTDLIVGTPSVLNNIVTTVLKYPTTNGDGRYKLTFACMLSTGQTRQFDFKRVIAENT